MLNKKGEDIRGFELDYAEYFGRLGAKFSQAQLHLRNIDYACR